MKNVHIKEVEVKGKEWEKVLDEVFKKKVKDVSIDGFRKGKCPKNVYMQKVGIESLYMDAVDKVSADSYYKLLEDEKLLPVCDPKIDIKTIDKDHVIIEYTVITKPEVKLGKYKNLGLKKDKVTVTEKEITEEIARISSKLADIVEKTEGKVEMGNTAVIDFEGYMNGEKFEGGTGANYPLEIGSNTFIPGFEDGVVGMKVGETKDINLKFPENYTPELSGKEVTFKVTVNTIKEKVLPEMNEDFFKDLGYKDIKTEEELRKEVKKSLTEVKEEENNNKYFEKVLDEACNNMEVEINEEIIDAEIDRMLEQFENQLKMQGISLDQYLTFANIKKDDFKKDMIPEATKRIKSRYLLDEVVNKEKIDATEEEVDKYIDEQTKKYEISKEEFLKYFGTTDMIKYDLKMHKAMDLICE